VAFFDYSLINGQSLVRGDDYNLVARWQQGDPLAPVDLTGYQGTAYFFAPGVDASFASVPVLPLDATGQVSFTIPKSLSPTFPKGECTYSVALTDPGGSVSTLLRGRLRVV
jgi:hypothetical protein